MCSRYGVAIGAALAPLVRGLMWICAPITWPLGKLLDFVLGHEDVVMKRAQLKAMVQLHHEGAGAPRRAAACVRMHGACAHDACLVCWPRAWHAGLHARMQSGPCAPTAAGPVCALSAPQASAAS